MLQIIHNVRLDGTDDIGMILFAVGSCHRGFRHHILLSHPYARFAPVLDMLTPQALSHTQLDVFNDYTMLRTRMELTCKRSASCLCQLKLTLDTTLCVK